MASTEKASSGLGVIGRNSSPGNIFWKISFPEETLSSEVRIVSGEWKMEGVRGKRKEERGKRRKKKGKKEKRKKEKIIKKETWIRSHKAI
jgi:hypothetical protein